MAREDLGDLRVVDGQGRQWPYLVERDEAKLRIRVRLTGPTGKDPSHYRLTFPASELRLDELTLETEPPFIDRAYRVTGTTGGDRGDKDVTLTSGRFVRRALDRGPLKIQLAAQRLRSLELLVSDGNEAPLSFTSVQVELLLPELSLAAPAGDYFLLLGNPEDTVPRYELAQVRDVVFALEGAPVGPRALEGNPDYSVRARIQTESGQQTTLLWVAIGVAVVTLGLLTLRLAGKDSKSSERS